MKTFSRIHDNISIKELDNGLFLIVYLIVTIFLSGIIYFFNFPNIAVLILITSLILKNYFRKFLPDWLEEKDTVGNFSFTDFGLVLNLEKNIPYQEIKFLTVNTNYIKNRKFTTKDIQHNGLGSLKIKCKSDETKIVKFILNTDKDWENLKEVLKSFYKQKIKVKEYLFNHELKSILLHPNWTYEEIQMLKKELNTDDFYA